MITPRLVLCGLQEPELDLASNGRQVVDLKVSGNERNVYISLENVARVLGRHISPRLIDFLEIAAYVYSADCGTRRGEEWTEDGGIEPWARDFHFVIAVRDLAFWQKTEVADLLRKTLFFYSDDQFRFEFTPLKQQHPVQDFLNFTSEDWPFYEVDRVVMFSGGLDSLAGAVVSARQGANLVLVSHRPTPAVYKKQHDLFNQLQATFSNPMIHIPVWINKHGNFGRENTQRTRSFLYTAVGTIVAQSLRAGGIQFFENGIVSLNFPVADEVVRARASRTTHPLALRYMEQLCCLVTERTFVLENPFIFETKTDVVRKMAEGGAEHLIGQTCSCAHTMFKSKNQWHCGMCSQCIDRRIAIVAAGLTQYDPELDYVENVFVGSREKLEDQNMAVDYTRHAFELYNMSETEIASRFNGPISRAVIPFADRREAADKFVAMHKRHGEAVYRVLTEQVTKYAGELIQGTLPSRSMLRLIAGNEHLTPTWTRFAKKISSVFQKGIPIACQTEKPANELRFQEICDGLLCSMDSDLIREFPFMRWSSSLTKPDWSSEIFELWVEAKYVREKKDIRTITEDIAADITKYGDNGRRVLFVVYDPKHYIQNEDTFSGPIISRPSMLVSFIR